MPEPPGQELSGLEVRGEAPLEVGVVAGHLVPLPVVDHTCGDVRGVIGRLLCGRSVKGNGGVHPETLKVVAGG